MPKQRITKEMVVNAAFEIARKSGMEQVMVKNIADKKYIEQLTGYKNFIKYKTNKKVNLYLYSIIDSNILEI